MTTDIKGGAGHFELDYTAAKKGCQQRSEAEYYHP